MTGSKPSRMYPLSTTCPLCGKHLDYLVGARCCITDDGSNAAMPLRLFASQCDSCAKRIGMHLKLTSAGIEVVDSGAYGLMWAKDLARIASKCLNDQKEAERRGLQKKNVHIREYRINCHFLSFCHYDFNGNRDV